MWGLPRIEGRFRFVAVSGEIVELGEFLLLDCCFWKGSAGRAGEGGGADFAMAEEWGLPLELLETEFCGDPTAIEAADGSDALFPAAEIC